MSTTYCRCTPLYVPLSRHAQGIKHFPSQGLKLLSKLGDILIYFDKTLLGNSYPGKESTFLGPGTLQKVLALPRLKIG